MSSTAGSAAREGERAYNDMSEKVRQVGSSLKEQAQNVYDSAGKAARDTFEEVKERGQHTFETLKEQGGKTMESMESTVREQPMKSLLVAAGFGLLAGLMISRR